MMYRKENRVLTGGLNSYGSITSDRFMEKTVEILSKLEHDPIHELMNLKKKLNEGSITSDEFKEKTVEILSKK